MESQLFPIRSPQNHVPKGVLTLDPYREDGVWLFDDPATGLQREPFVGDINRILDQFTASIPDAPQGFRLLFSSKPFEGMQDTFNWLRADPVEGNWYRSEATGMEGWLCPALFCYFPTAPAMLYARAEAKVAN